MPGWSQFFGIGSTNAHVVPEEAPIVETLEHPVCLAAAGVIRQTGFCTEDGESSG